MLINRQSSPSNLIIIFEKKKDRLNFEAGEKIKEHYPSILERCFQEKQSKENESN
jgi:hypothetical protein